MVRATRTRRREVISLPLRTVLASLRKKSRSLQITTDTVCDRCNNVWLSNFENNAVKPLVTPLIQGTDDVIIKPAEQWTLAACAFKMALLPLLEIAAKENPQPFFPAAERKQSTQGPSSF